MHVPCSIEIESRTREPPDRNAASELRAMMVRRKKSNLSRTLKKLQEAGIVALEKGPGRTRAPRLVARRVTLDLDLFGAGGVATVEPSSR